VSELFNEVDEEVRRERLKKLWDEYSIYIIAGALLIIAAVGGWRGYQYLEAKKAAEAGAAFDKAVELSEQNKHAEAEAAFTDLAAKAPSGYRMLARLRAAAEVANRDPQAAAKLYDDIAADRSIGATERDLARVRAAGLLLETTSYPSMLQRLEPTTRAARAVGLARQRYGGCAAVAGSDCQRRRDAAKPALPCRGAARVASAGREKLTAGKKLSEKSTMRRSQRLIAAAVVIALSGALAGCTGSMSSFDPSDLLDFLDTKKKLPGERKPVFPEGVPGLEQGVPKGLYKGSAQEQIDQQNAAAAAAAASPPEEPKSKHLAKSTGKGKQAATAATAPAEEPAAAPDPNAAAEEEGSTAAAPPAPKPKKIVRRRTTAPPPDQPPSAPSAQSPQQSAAPFPAPLPSGTFTR
jgi:hypothetical protein